MMFYRIPFSHHPTAFDPITFQYVLQCTAPGNFSHAPLFLQCSLGSTGFSGILLTVMQCSLIFLSLLSFFSALFPLSLSLLCTSPMISHPSSSRRGWAICVSAISMCDNEDLT